MFEFNVFVQLNNQNNRFDLAAYVCCNYWAFFLLLLISEYMQKKANELIHKQQINRQMS